MSCDCREMRCECCGNVNRRKTIIQNASAKELIQNDHVKRLIEGLRQIQTEVQIVGGVKFKTQGAHIATDALETFKEKE